MGDGGGGQWLVRMEWHPAGWSVCLPLSIFPCTTKSRSSLLAPAHVGGPGKRAVQRLCVCVMPHENQAYNQCHCQGDYWLSFSFFSYLRKSAPFLLARGMGKFQARSSLSHSCITLLEKISRAPTYHLTTGQHLDSLSLEDSWQLNAPTVKVKQSLLSHRQTAMTTQWSSLSRRTAQRENIYNVYIAPCQDTQSAHTWITQIDMQITPCPPFVFRKRSTDGATPNWGSRQSIAAYYSFIDPEGTKGWVGLVGLTYSGVFTHISDHPSATGRAQDREVCRPKTDVVPLFNASDQAPSTWRHTSRGMLPKKNMKEEHCKVGTLALWWLFHMVQNRGAWLGWHPKQPHLHSTEWSAN